MRLPHFLRRTHHAAECSRAGAVLDWAAASAPRTMSLCEVSKDSPTAAPDATLRISDCCDCAELDEQCDFRIPGEWRIRHAVECSRPCPRWPHLRRASALRASVQLVTPDGVESTPHPDYSYHYNIFI
jgi:hypothetical protein